MNVVAKTHEVLNQPFELVDYNLFSGDAALKEGVAREGAGWASADLEAFGARLGDRRHARTRRARQSPSARTRHPRPLRPARRSRALSSRLSRADARSRSRRGCTPRPGPSRGRARMSPARRATTCRAQVEAGHGCPITMTFAATPCLRLQPDLASEWLPKIHARVYDPRNVPVARKSGVTIGMAMTEKQGGSDVRANTTRAMPIGATGWRGLRNRRPQVLRLGADVRRLPRARPGARRPHLLPRAALASRRDARTRSSSSASSARWATSPTRRARPNGAARSPGASGRRAAASPRSSRWWRRRASIA